MMMMMTTMMMVMMTQCYPIAYALVAREYGAPLNLLGSDLFVSESRHPRERESADRICRQLLDSNSLTRLFGLYTIFNFHSSARSQRVSLSLTRMGGSFHFTLCIFINFNDLYLPLKSRSESVVPVYVCACGV